MRAGKLVFGAIFMISAAVTAAGAKSELITSEKALLAAVGNKKLSAGKGSEILVGSDGTITGTLGGDPIIESKWTWEGKTFCRSLATAKKKFPRACQSVTVDGDSITFGKTTWEIK